MRCNSMQVFIYRKITLHVSGVYRSHHREYIKLYQKLQLQFDVLAMMGAIDTRKMYSNFAVNKHLHTVASHWILLIQSHDARNSEYKIESMTSYVVLVMSMSLKMITLQMCLHGEDKSSHAEFIWNTSLLHQLRFRITKQ